MFWLFDTAKAAEHGETTQAAAHHTPIIVELVNHYFGQAAYDFEMKYTYPIWKSFFAKFHTTPEAVFGPYTPETRDSVVHGDVFHRLHPQRGNHLDSQRKTID